MPKRPRIVPKNVLANERLRRTYVSEPEPEKLVLVKSKISGGNNLKMKGKSGLFYDLSQPFLYVDEQDIDGLAEMIDTGTVLVEQDIPVPAKQSTSVPVVQDVSVQEVSIETPVSRDERDIEISDVVADDSGIGSSGVGARKRGRPRKSGRSENDGAPDNEEAGRVPAWADEG